ncbi:Interferon-induced GTP-binding protein Mx1 [Penicillium rolfsii]|nr:Interferon-induced GTP-binding protein Mx1 [Penicillium rolfsii]
MIHQQSPAQEMESADSESSEADWTAIDFNRRLNQIDRIRANGVGDHVALPQLVVCGDQSAGKSSVLEGISGIPFPRQDGLCTRFATEITNRITATITPHSSRDEEGRRRLALFRREFRSFEELPSIIKAVGLAMGADAPAFAADVLRLELVGRTGLYLTIVDLPGLILVSEDERDLVTWLIYTLKVHGLSSLQLSQLVAISTLRRARRYNKDRLRTVRIITKPDLINKGTKPRVVRLAKNLDRIKLKLGFFLIKNPSPVCRRTRKRAEQEFFSRELWRHLGLDLSRRELLKVREELRELLKRNSLKLASLGMERNTTIQAGIDRDYSGRDAKFFDAKGEEFINRLRATVYRENEKFANHIREYSQTRRIAS